MSKSLRKFATRERVIVGNEIGRRGFIRGALGGLGLGAVVGEKAGDANIRGTDRELQELTEHFSAFAGLVATRTAISRLLPGGLEGIANDEAQLRDLFTGITVRTEPDLVTRYRLLIPSDKETEGLTAAVTATHIVRSPKSDNYDSFNLKAYFEPTPDGADTGEAYRLYNFDGRNLPKNDMLSYRQASELATHVVTDPRFGPDNWMSEVVSSYRLLGKVVWELEKSFADGPDKVTGVVVDTSGHFEYTQLGYGLTE